MRTFEGCRPGGSKACSSCIPTNGRVDGRVKGRVIFFEDNVDRVRVGLRDAEVVTERIMGIDAFEDISYPPCSQAKGAGWGGLRIASELRMEGCMFLLVFAVTQGSTADELEGMPAFGHVHNEAD